MVRVGQPKVPTGFSILVLAVYADYGTNTNIVGA